jgi:hypothetical protein
MAETDAHEKMWTLLCRLVWCWLRRHPQRFISWWLVKPTREGGAFTSHGVTGPSGIKANSVMPFVAVEWTCPNCGKLRLVQGTK